MKEGSIYPWACPFARRQPVGALTVLSSGSFTGLGQKARVTVATCIGFQVAYEMFNTVFYGRTS